MVDLNSILKSLPISDVAAQLGVSPEVAEQALTQASSVLIGGLAKNASTPEGASALEAALQKHAGFEGVGSIADIDVADGSKILDHIFGGKQTEVAEALNAAPATAAGLDFGKVLPALAPILMGMLGSGQKQSGGGIGDLLGGLLGGGQTQQASGGGLGSILGGLLGGGGGTQQASGGGLGDILGGLLGGGGGTQQASGGGLGDILGGLLGGGGGTQQASGGGLGDALNDMLGSGTDANNNSSGGGLGDILGGLLGGNK